MVLLRKIVTIIYCLAFLGLVQGQCQSISFGINYGIGLSSIKGHEVLNSRYQAISSFSFGVDVRYLPHEKYEIMFGLSVVQYGGKFTANERALTIEMSSYLLGDTLERKYFNHFTYLAFPLVLKRTILETREVQIWGCLGGYYARLIKQSWDYEILESFTIPEQGVIQFNYKPYDLGYTTGLGIDHKLSDNIEISTAAIYSGSFSNIIENRAEEVTAKHQRFNLLFSLYFIL